jgi:hypothetical protein
MLNNKILVDNPVRCGRKTTEMFYGKMDVLLSKDEEYKGPIFRNYNIGKKKLGPLCKKRLKTDYGKVQGLI